jgi:hypothetical protein
MSRFVSTDTSDRVKSLMFGEQVQVGDDRSRFLQEELVRYIPQLAGRTDQRRYRNSFLVRTRYILGGRYLSLVSQSHR